MPSPVQSPPPIDAAPSVPSLRTLGTGAQQAAAGNDPRFGIGADKKSGVLIPGSFSGVPKKATVTFTAPYSDLEYSITLAVITDGTKGFAPFIESKAVGGFVVNLGSGNVATLIEVGWHTLLKGS